MPKIIANIYIHAPQQKVWELIANHEAMGKWPGIKAARVLTPGGAERNGVGAERELLLGGLRIVERITAYQAPKLLRYQIIKSSLPVLKHRGGTVQLTARGRGTEVTWTTDLSLTIPLLGRALDELLHLVFQKALNDVLLYLKQRLEK